MKKGPTVTHQSIGESTLFSVFPKNRTLQSEISHLSRTVECTIVITRCPYVCASAVVNFSHFWLLPNNRADFEGIWQEASTQLPLPSLCFPIRSENENRRSGLWLTETNAEQSTCTSVPSHIWLKCRCMWHKTPINPKPERDWPKFYGEQEHSVLYEVCFPAWSKTYIKDDLASKCSSTKVARGTKVHDTRPFWSLVCTTICFGFFVVFFLEGEGGTKYPTRKSTDQRPCSTNTRRVLHGTK